MSEAPLDWYYECGTRIVSSPSWIHLYNDVIVPMQNLNRKTSFTTRNVLTERTQVIIRSVIPHIVILLVCVVR